MPDMLKVDLPKNQSSILKVIGVGGGGCNAVNYMFNQGITGVDFIVCNTDAKSLDISPVPNKIQLGKGLGAGNIPAVAKKAAEEKADEIRALLEKNTQMLFITAGMGGGTGTGAAPVIASIAKEIELLDEHEKKILIVAIVTLPFSFEGRKRKLQADEGIIELKKHVDAILIINNDKLREFGDLPLGKAFEKADNILTTAAKGIAEIITVKAYVNIDFKDVNTIMKNSGVALMGTGIAEGENRAFRAVEMAINSPLLNDNNIKGSKDILLYFSSGNAEITIEEIHDITDYILEEAGPGANIIWGAGKDLNLGDKLVITLVATGFDKATENINTESKPNTTIIPFDPDNEPTNISNIRNPYIQTQPPPPPAYTSTNDEDINDIKKIEDIPFIVENNMLNDDLNNEPSFTPSSSAEESLEQPYLLNIKENTEPLKPTPTSFPKAEPEPSTEIDDNDCNRIIDERIKRLKDLSMKIRTPEGLTEIENQPAYIRKNITLVEVTPSSKSEISTLNVSGNESDEGELKNNKNTYLHTPTD